MAGGTRATDATNGTAAQWACLDVVSEHFKPLRTLKEAAAILERRAEWEAEPATAELCSRLQAAALAFGEALITAVEHQNKVQTILRALEDEATAAANASLPPPPQRSPPRKPGL